MSRTTARLRVTGAAAAASGLLLLCSARPAQAHGAPTSPVSRSYACSPDGGSYTKTAACRAAIAANGAPFTFFDDVRVPNVNGRDRQTIPDGKLCGGGLDAYKGLNLARTDWPSTRFAAGARMTMTYAAPIPHEGSFRLYLTKPGYDPTKPLTWSDLPTQPFATVKDPALSNGAYHFTVTLPADRTGHQVLYTVWQTSSTPDTYYSCSDVVFPGGGSTAPAASKKATAPAHSASASASPKPSKSSTPSASASRSSAPSASSAPAEPAAAQAESTPVASATGARSGPSAPLWAGGAAAVLVLTGGAALAMRLRRR
ncbi:lytic polysaccharide monooxygenase [Streptomyces mangrovisoli]|uniref:Chitin-binding protein n=1 Tax=Streptomyces mangrovisoli TaxID=1428628 RepID=A0A1J4NP76_9ACTN|nr:lytic polysaccharide monooxygenase [Streptomyces mangrovisoli]OIJ63069.1 chitin-binding protein [Streptomyces mangrovisoli]